MDRLPALVGDRPSLESTGNRLRGEGAPIVPRGPEGPGVSQHLSLEYSPHCIKGSRNRNFRGFQKTNKAPSEIKVLGHRIAG